MRFQLTPEVRDEALRLYDEEIAYVDDALGRLLSALDRHGKA